MPRAGFTAISSGRISFRKDGRWYCDGEPITNRAICRLYARAMTIDANGHARLELGEDRALVDVEDTPWVVTGIDGSPEQGIEIILNDDSREPLDLTTLTVGAGDVLYARARGGLRVRFLRPAYYHLMRHAQPAPGGGCLLRSGAGEITLRPPS
jgi:hypothetical protein